MASAFGVPVTVSTPFLNVADIISRFSNGSKFIMTCVPLFSQYRCSPEHDGRHRRRRRPAHWVKRRGTRGGLRPERGSGGGGGGGGNLNSPPQSVTCAAPRVGYRSKPANVGARAVSNLIPTVNFDDGEG